MTFELIVAMLKALYPDLSLETILNIARDRLQGKLTQAQLDEFADFRVQALRGER